MVVFSFSFLLRQGLAIGWPGICFADQVGLKLGGPPGPAELL